MNLHQKIENTEHQISRCSSVLSSLKDNLDYFKTLKQPTIKELYCDIERYVLIEMTRTSQQDDILCSFTTKEGVYLDENQLDIVKEFIRQVFGVKSVFGHHAYQHTFIVSDMGIE